MNSLAWPKCWFTSPPPLLATATSTLGEGQPKALSWPGRRPVLFGQGLAGLLNADVDGLAGFQAVVCRHFHELLFGEFLAAVFTQEAHGIGPALTAVAHHLHIAGALVLNGFSALWGWGHADRSSQSRCRAPGPRSGA
jgi:hypothetical protein